MPRGNTFVLLNQVTDVFIVIYHNDMNDLKKEVEFCFLG
jgi:hypothetical protein